MFNITVIRDAFVPKILYVSFSGGAVSQYLCFAAIFYKTISKYSLYGLTGMLYKFENWDWDAVKTVKRANITSTVITHGST